MKNTADILLELLRTDTLVKTITNYPQIEKSTEYCDFLDLHGVRIKYKQSDHTFVIKIYEDDFSYIVETIVKPKDSETILKVMYYDTFIDMKQALLTFLQNTIKIKPTPLKAVK